VRAAGAGQHPDQPAGRGVPQRGAAVAGQGQQRPVRAERQRRRPGHLAGIDRVAGLLPGGDVPDTGGAVVGGGGEQPPVGAHGQRRHGAVVAGEGLAGAPSRGEVPDLDDRSGSGEDPVAVRSERDRAERVLGADLTAEAARGEVVLGVAGRPPRERAGDDRRQDQGDQGDEDVRPPVRFVRTRVRIRFPARAGRAGLPGGAGT
jgi:hypothetical protein